MPHNLRLARPLAGLRAAVLAVFAMFAGACASDNLDPSIGDNLGLESPEAAVSDSLASDSLATDSLLADTLGVDSLITDSLVLESPEFRASSRKGTPFGFWRLEYTQLGSDWTSLQGGASPRSIRRNLELARRRGARVFVQFAGRRRHYQNRDGSFSLPKFKRLLAQFKGVNLDSYIADGTLAGHMMIDEPSDKSNWNGRPMSYRMVEDAAKASKAIWPKLPALVRSVPTWLDHASFRYVHLDGAWAQYSARKGNVENYRDAETGAAKRAGLKVVWGLNVIDGGNGSSRKRGSSKGRYNMSASELVKYGKTLLGASNTCGFLMWMYHGGYVRDRKVLSALKALSRHAKGRPAHSCRQ